MVFRKQEYTSMSGKRKLFWSLFSALLAVLSIWAVLSQSRKWSVEKILDSLAHANKLWLLAAALCTVLFVLLEGVALSSVLKRVGYRRPLSRSILYSTADIYFSAITPSATGGQPASAYFMVKDGIPAGVAAVSLLINLILYTLSLVTLGLAAILLHFPLLGKMRLLSRILILAGFLVQLGLVFLFFMMLGKGQTVFAWLERFLHFLHRKKLIHRLERRLERLRTAQTDFEACARTMRDKPSIFFVAFLWNLAQRAAQLAVPMCVFLALGGSLGRAGTLFASQCMVALGYSAVPIPGAMGIADFLMVDAFTGFIGLEDAIRLEMLSRGLSFYICVAVSGVVTLLGYLALRKRQRKERERHDRSI